MEIVIAGYGTVRYVVIAIFLATLLGGCALAPVQRDTDGDLVTIVFYENRSVDREVRDDFDAALRLLREEQYQEGIALLHKVAQRTKNNSAPYINLAIAYMRTGEMELAEDNLKLALEINPEHPATLNEYALLYRRLGRFVEAKQMYEKLLTAYPEFMPARKNLGILCELYLDDPGCALEHYRRYSEVVTDDEDVKLWIVSLQQKSGG